MQFHGQGILLDIEGTTSSVSFVYDEMFPFARRELENYLRDHWATPACRETCELIAVDAGHASADAWFSDADELAQQILVRDEVHRLMDGDIKATGLKALQGHIWHSGFQTGDLVAHVYDDVPPALHSWHEQGFDVRVYSSGSVAAQKLFFGHTVAGSLLELLRGHYDTQTGPKRAQASYEAITSEFRIPAKQILFLSDVVAELDAARSAGLQTGLAMRPGNAVVEDSHGHPTVDSFADLVATRS